MLFEKLGFDRSIYTASEAELEAVFIRIAAGLLNKAIIKTPERSFHFKEIEVYFHNISHPDPFVHKAMPQLEFGRWYSHGAGMDLTLGDKETETYFGILIRRIQSTTDVSIFPRGPLLTFDELISSHGNAFGESYMRIEFPRFDLNQAVRTTKRKGLENRLKKANDAEIAKSYFEKKYAYIV